MLQRSKLLTMRRSTTLLATTKGATRKRYGPPSGRTALSVRMNQASFRITNTAFFHASPTLSSSTTVSASLNEQPRTSPSGGPTNEAQLGRKRGYGVLLSIVIFLSLGYVSGHTLSLFLIPPPLPPAGSREDQAYLQNLRAEADQLPMVQELRGHPEEWRELEAHVTMADSKQPMVDKTISNSREEGRLQVSNLISSIWGSFGIGYYLLFWNAKERRAISIVHLGVSLAGWPSIVHGGALATLLQENMEHFVQLTHDTTTMPTNQADMEQLSSIRSLQLKYRRPTHSERFYVIRTQGDDSSPQRQYTIRSHIEDARSGLVSAEAVGETSP